MKIAPMAINSFAKWLVGGVPFESAKRIVQDLNNTNMTGAQKRDAAFHELGLLGYSIAGHLLNLAIELAVAWLKSRDK